jgi:hypothetical protein
LLTIVRSDALSVQPFARIIIQVADENVDRSRSSRVLAVRSASWALSVRDFSCQRGKLVE